MKKNEIVVYMENGLKYQGKLKSVTPFGQKWIKIQTKSGEIVLNMLHVVAILYPTESWQ